MFKFVLALPIFWVFLTASLISQVEAPPPLSSAMEAPEFPFKRWDELSKDHVVIGAGVVPCKEDSRTVEWSHAIGSYGLSGLLGTWVIWGALDSEDQPWLAILYQNLGDEWWPGTWIYRGRTDVKDRVTIVVESVKEFPQDENLNACELLYPELLATEHF